MLCVAACSGNELQLSELFVEEINPVMRKMGYCCGQKLAFTPLALFCYGQSMCTIARDQPYHVYEATLVLQFPDAFNFPLL